MTITLLSGSWVQALPAGTYIDNQAQATFRNNTSNTDEQITSVLVSAIVEPRYALQLSADTQRTAAAGQSLLLPHRLINNSSVADQITLSLTEQSGDDFDFAAATLWIDTNTNNQLDGADTALGQGTELLLVEGENLALLIEATLPQGLPIGSYGLLQLEARGSGADSVTVLDRVTVGAGEPSVLIKPPLKSSIAGGEKFQLDIVFLAAIDSDLTGRQVLVDGQPETLVLLETRLPAGVFLDSPVIAPEQYETLYKLAGTAADNYTTSPPSDLRQVSAVAIAKPEIGAQEAPAFALVLQAEGETRDIILVTTASYDGGQFSSAPYTVTLQQNVDNGSLLTINDINPGIQQVFLRSNGPMALRFTCFICDSDPDLAEAVTSEVSSAATGDIEPVDLMETGPRDGVFFTDTLPLLPVEDAEPVADDGIMSVASNDTLTLTVKDVDGNTLEQQTVLVDPSGYVFNSVTGEVIVNAEVTLYRLAADGSETLAEVFFDVAGTRPHPNPTRTDETGLYQFPFVAQADYRLEVTDPTEGFSFASQRSGAEMADIADRYTNLTGYDASDNPVRGRLITRPAGPSYGAEFTVATEAVFTDIPLDPMEQPVAADTPMLGLTLSADRKQATFGEAVRYSARVSNLSGQPTEQTRLTVQAPRGFRLLANGVYWNGELLRDAVVQDGEQLVFTVGSMAVDETAELQFRLVLTPAAQGGNGVVMARATAEGAAVPGLPARLLSSAFARVKVKLDAGVFRDDGVIIGKIFRDCNSNGWQDDDGSEPGLSGIRLYLQNGRYAITDASGRYSFARLRPGSYVVKADPGDDQRNWQLTRRTVRNQGSDQLILVDLQAGELHRADFPLAGCQASSPAAHESASVAAPLQEPVVAAEAALISQPRDGDRIAGGQTPVVVTGRIGLSYELSVNGVLVPDSRLGEQVIDKAAGQQRLSYFAVELAAGQNTVQVVTRDTWGNERGRQQLTVYRPDQLSALQWQVPESMPAEGTEQRLRLQLLDANGVNIAGDAPVTVTIVDGNELGMSFVDTDIDALLPGLQRLAVDGELSLPVMAPARAGTVTVQASVGDLVTEHRLQFVPAMRNWVVAGLVEGELTRQTSQRGTLAADRQHSGFAGSIDGNDTEWNGGKNRAAVRGAVFAKGTVKQDYLVTLIADTDKRDEDDWAGRLDLERDYAIYGDDSVQGAEGEAEKGLYLRVEKGSSFAQIGDFRPGADNRRTRVGGYNRKLYGLQQRYQGEHWQIETFASQLSSQQVIDNLRLRGTTGPFSLSKRDIILNSEKIEVVTRSRAPDGDIIAFETLTPFIDYELDPVLGRVILRSPMSGSDATGRPRYLRITYNVDEDSGAERDLVGTDISYRFTDLTVGGRILHERDSASHYTLSSINSLYQLDDNTTLIAEYADSRNEGLDVDNQGQAVNSRLEHRSEQRNVQLSLSGASSNFDNDSAAVTADSRSADFNWQEHISDTSDVWASARWFENSATAVNTYAAEVGATHAIYNALKVGASVEETRTDSSAGVKLRESSVGLHSRYQPGWLEDMSLEANAYQALGSQRQRQKLAVDYRLSNQGSVGLSWERFSGYDVNGDLETGSDSRQRWAMGYRQQVHSTTEVFSEYRFEEAMNGLENTVATGLRYGYDLNEELRLVAQAERTLDLADNPGAPARYSGSLGLSGFAEDNHKWLARLEMLAADQQRWLQEFRWTSRVNTDWSVLAKERLQWRDGFTEVNAEMTAGLAYRPTTHNRWDWLGSYSLERERLGEATLTRQRGRNTVNIRPAQRWTLTGGLVLQHTEETGSEAYTSLAWMTRLRLRYDISANWSVGAMGSYFKDQRLGGGSRGWGVEIQRALGKQFMVAVGLQHFDYQDSHVDPDSAYRDGLRVRFSGKFDERSLSGLWRLLE